MANAGTVTVDFAAEVAKFNATMKQVETRVKSVESGFKKMAGVVDSALKLFSVGIAVNFIRSAAEAADAAAKLSDKLGISTERLAAFDLAAADAGVSTQTLTKLFTDAQRRLGEAAGGTGEAKDALEALGLNVRQLQQLAPDELFLRYADSLATVTNRSEQFAIAQDLFGRSAQEAYTLIAAGRGAIESAAATVDKLGLAISRVDASKIEEANDKLGLLSRTSKAFGTQLAAALAPFVSEFVDRITESGVAADQTRSKLDIFARAVFISFEIIANAARTFDLAVSGAFFAQAKAMESTFSLVRRGLELTASLDAAVGLDSLAAKFKGFAESAGNAESFAAALSEQAALRIKNAANNVKSFAQIFADADRIVAESQARAEQAAANNNKPPEGGGSLFEQKQIELFKIEDATKLHNDVMLQLQQDFLAIQEDTTRKLDEDRHREFLQRKIDRERQAEQQILAVKQGAQNAAIGLLGVLAQRSKIAALALIAFEKIRAIAQAKINTAVAVTNALASVPYPQNFAAAAQVQAMGNLQIALIAATGLLEAGNVLRSSAPGAPLGSPQNPVFTNSNATEDAAGPAGAQQNRQISITFTGVFTKDAAREIAEQLKDVIDNSDIHIIGPNSSQARELRGE